MSRIGNNPIIITEGVTLTQEGNLITVKGKLGELFQEIDESILLTINENIVTLSRVSDHKDHRAKHGLYRALIANMIEGVSKSFTKTLTIPYSIFVLFGHIHQFVSK